MSEEVLLSIDGPIATITINRPDSRNALNAGVWLGLEKAANEIWSREEVLVAILTGAGERAFSAGIDVKAVASGALGQIGSRGRGGYGSMAKMKGIFTMYEDMPIPVIAAIQGYCLGAGMELTLACDIRLAAEDAVFSLPEVKLGIVPDMGSTQRLPRLVGLGMAKELIYTSRMITAAEALRIGLVNHVYPKDKLREEALKLAQEIAGNPPGVVQGAKRAVNYTMSVPLEAGIRLETEIAAAANQVGTLAQQAEALRERKG